MPHQCTSCGHVFADGSKEMLSGCPDCGGTKFQFHPEGTDVPEEPPDDADPPDPPASDSAVAGSVGSAAATVRDLVGSGSGGPDADAPAPESPPAGSSASGTDGTDVDTHQEDAAQASARSDVVSRDELPHHEATDESPPETDVSSSAPAEPDGTDRPDLSDLRAELNEQFESIRIVEPGQYELNLMELYDREEYIVALQEDGHYSIQVPGSWRE